METGLSSKFFPSNPQFNSKRTEKEVLAQYPDFKKFVESDPETHFKTFFIDYSPSEGRERLEKFKELGLKVAEYLDKNDFGNAIRSVCETSDFDLYLEPLGKMIQQKIEREALSGAQLKNIEGEIEALLAEDPVAPSRNLTFFELLFEALASVYRDLGNRPEADRIERKKNILFEDVSRYEAFQYGMGLAFLYYLSSNSFRPASAALRISIPLLSPLVLKKREDWGGVLSAYAAFALGVEGKSAAAFGIAMSMAMRVSSLLKDVITSPMIWVDTMAGAYFHPSSLGVSRLEGAGIGLAYSISDHFSLRKRAYACADRLFQKGVSAAGSIWSRVFKGIDRVQLDEKRDSRIHIRDQGLVK